MTTEYQYKRDFNDVHSILKKLDGIADDLRKMHMRHLQEGATTIGDLAERAADAADTAGFLVAPTRSDEMENALMQIRKEVGAAQLALDAAQPDWDRFQHHLMSVVVRALHLAHVSPGSKSLACVVDEAIDETFEVRR